MKRFKYFKLEKSIKISILDTITILTLAIIGFNNFDSKLILFIALITIHLYIYYKNVYTKN